MPDTSAMTMGDLLGKSVPSTSATSDMPDLEAGGGSNGPDQGGSGSTASDQGGAQLPTAPAPEPIETPEVEVSAEPDKPHIGLTKEELERERAYERKRADDLSAQLRQSIEAIERLTNSNLGDEVRKVEQQDPRPKRADFNDPDEYEANFTAWASREGVRVARVQAEQLRIEDDQKVWVKKTQDQWTERRTKFKEDHPDVDQVLESADVKISNAVSHALLQADDGPAIAYHLAKNPQIAERLISLSVDRQLMEIGRLSASLIKKAAPTRSSSPIIPIRGRSAVMEKGPDEETMDEYAARRQREIRPAPSPQPVRH